MVIFFEYRSVFSVTVNSVFRFSVRFHCRDDSDPFSILQSYASIFTHETAAWSTRLSNSFSFRSATY
jgi:hypothetical protein